MEDESLKVSFDDRNLLRLYSVFLITLLLLFSFSTVVLVPDETTVYYRLFMLWSILGIALLLYVALLIYANTMKRVSFRMGNGVKCRVECSDISCGNSTGSTLVAGDEGCFPSSSVSGRYSCSRDEYVAYWLRFWSNVSQSYSRSKEISIPIRNDYSSSLCLMEALEIAIWTLSKSKVMDARITFLVDRSKCKEVNFFALKYIC